jgi:hypothetical protein
MRKCSEEVCVGSGVCGLGPNVPITRIHGRPLARPSKAMHLVPSAQAIGTLGADSQTSCELGGYMNCPYCGVLFSLDGVDADHCFPKFGKLSPFGGVPARDEEDQTYSITSHKCPECRKQIMWLNKIEFVETADGLTQREVGETALLFPKYPIKQIPGEVPEELASDFREAYETLPTSAKASAALSRRCLQNLIRQQEGIVEKSLFAEIRQLLKRNKLPKYLADDLDSIRNVGNFAAHPIKDTNTGQIVEVEPGEAEWTLEVLEELLRFYFIDELRSKARRDALNQKLKDSGQQPMLKP